MIGGAGGAAASPLPFDGVGSRRGVFSDDITFKL